MMNSQLSNKIRVASFICMVMVVYRHSLNYLAFFDSWNGYGISGWVEDGMSIITEIAIPYFFIVSGFFFFRNNYGIIDCYKGMLKKKSRTLLTPFIIWNLVGVFALWFINKNNVGDSFFSCLYHLAMSQWYGPLWFVRDLMILMILSPLYSWIFNVNKWGITFFVLAICFYLWVPVDCELLSSEGILFFLIGGIVQKNSDILQYKVPLLFTLLLVMVWLIAGFGGMASYSPFLHKFITLWGILTFWLLLDELNGKDKLLPLTEYSFLIYVLHFYIIKALKSFFGYYFHGSDIAALLSYLFIPLLVIAIIIVSGKPIKKHFPAFFSIVTGGR